VREEPRKENTFSAALGFMAGRENSYSTLVLLLFRGLSPLARGPGFVIHFLFAVQHLFDAICSMSLFINRDLYDVN
jgi:hypothetical protein